jgi:hypothetical protein
MAKQTALTLLGLVRVYLLMSVENHLFGTFNYCRWSRLPLYYSIIVFSSRILDVEKDENFTLALSSQFGYHANESIMSITYSASKGIIAAGTDKGNVAMWKFMQNKVKFGDPESSWQLLHSKFLQETPITEIKVIFFAFFFFLLALCFISTLIGL